METKSKSNQRLIIILLAVLIVLLAIVLVVVLGKNDSQSVDNATPQIGYSTEAKVLLDQNSLQAAFNEALQNAEDGYVGLKYRNDAFSEDGTNFECYIANSEANKYDMFLTIFTDAEMTDQVFLSELVPPGSGFENITLSRALESGDHLVYVALTQVETDEETGNQVIKQQVIHTMDFHVTK